MPLYIKKPIPVHAFKWDGELSTLKQHLNKNEIIKWFRLNHLPLLIISTLEGKERCPIGDYIIKGVHNEFYPCNPVIFKKTYRKINKS